MFFFLEGAIESEAEHEIILQVLTDSMGFSAIVDRIGINDLIMERDEFKEGSPGVDELDSQLFYDRDVLHEETYETKGRSLFGYFGNDSLT